MSRHRLVAVLIALFTVFVPAGTSLALELVNESFEVGMPPAGWTTLTSGQGPQWSRTEAVAHTGAYSAVVFYGGPSQLQDEWLITPALDTRGLGELMLEWWEEARYWHPLYADYHEVLYSTTVPDDPAAYTVLLHMTPADHPIAGMGGDPVVLDLTDLIGQEHLYLALRYVGSAGDIWYVDDVRCYQPELRDVGVEAVGPDLAWFQVDDDIAATVTLENFGNEAVDCLVDLTVTSNGAPHFSQQLAAADLAPGEVRTVVFPTFTATGAGWYDLAAAITVAGDPDPANDHGAARCFAYSRDRLPYGLLITNWDCSGCPQANQALDAFLTANPDGLALVRVHCWWPGGGDDPMYLANVPECRWLVEDTPPESEYAPHLWLDGTVDAGAEGDAYATLIAARSVVPSSLDLSVASEADGTQARVTVNVLEPIAPETELVLRLAVTEDGIEAAGSNGEVHHEQVFRQLYPDTSGIAVPTASGVHEYLVDTPLDPDWLIDHLHLVAWVRDAQTKQVHNAARCAVTGGPLSTPEVAGPATLRGAYPNPFNPTTIVAFELPVSGRVELTLYDLTGRLVDVLAVGTYATGSHQVRWAGRDGAGRALPSGTYLLRLRTEHGEDCCKLVLCR